MRISLTDEVKQEQTKLYQKFMEEDPHLSWTTQPHTITGLIVGAIFVIYFAFFNDITSLEMQVKYGLIAVCGSYLLYSGLQMKDGLFLRPHPIIWRVVMGMAVLYFMLLIFVLFLSADNARYLLTYIDPSLNKPLPERSYAEHCELYTPDDPVSRFRHLYDTVNDEFMFAHLLGWFGKAILLRESYLCWSLSIIFEILEVTFAHLLPNFAECWWDHIILDIFVCNWLGLYLGLKVMNYFRATPYTWMAEKLPHMDEYHWEVLKSPRRLIGVLTLLVIFNLVELNAFFLKFVLWIPPPHPLNIIRLLIWWSIGLPGVREYYQFVTDSNCKKLGTSAWLCAGICGVEFLIWVKFGKGMFPNSAPPEIVWGWGIAIALFLVWAVVYYGFINKPTQAAQPLKNEKKKQ